MNQSQLLIFPRLLIPRTEQHRVELHFNLLSCLGVSSKDLLKRRTRTANDANPELGHS